MAERERRGRSLDGLTLKASSRAAEKRDLPTFNAQGWGGYWGKRHRVNSGMQIPAILRHDCNSAAWSPFLESVSDKPDSPCIESPRSSLRLLGSWHFDPCGRRYYIGRGWLGAFLPSLSVADRASLNGTGPKSSSKLHHALDHG